MYFKDAHNKLMMIKRIKLLASSSKLSSQILRNRIRIRLYRHLKGNVFSKHAHPFIVADLQMDKLKSETKMVRSKIKNSFSLYRYSSIMNKKLYCVI